MIVKQVRLFLCSYFKNSMFLIKRLWCKVGKVIITSVVECNGVQIVIQLAFMSKKGSIPPLRVGSQAKMSWKGNAVAVAATTSLLLLVLLQYTPGKFKYALHSSQMHSPASAGTLSHTITLAHTYTHAQVCKPKLQAFVNKGKKKLLQSGAHT